MSKRPFVLLFAAGCAAAFVIGVTAQAGSAGSFRVRNDTDATMVSLWLEPVDGKARQVLKATVEPDDTAAISTDADRAGCVYDVEAELDTGAELHLDAVDLCQLPDHTLALRD